MTIDRARLRYRLPVLLPAILLICAGLATANALPPLPQGGEVAPSVLLARVVDEAGSPVEGACYLHGAADVITTAMALAKPHARSDRSGRISAVIETRGVDGNSPHHAILVAPGRECVRWNLGRGSRGVTESDGRSIDMGTVVLRKAVTIHGLVRSSKGEPVVGARITGHDIFRARHLQMQIAEHCVSYATTNEKGRFKLEGVPARGIWVEIRAAGYQDFGLQHANRYTPIVAQLTEAGTTTGKVVDAAGKPVVAASVRVYFEHSEQTILVHSAADGGFSIPLRLAGRYRICAQPASDVAARASEGVWSERLRGPASDVRIELAIEDATAVAGVSIRAKAARGGEPVKAFRAAVVWADPRRWKYNQAFLDNSFQTLARRPSAGGALIFPGPGPGQPSTGRLILLAEGFAPKVVDNVEWDEKKPPSFVLELQPESVIEGVVVDKDSGEPIAGATVFVGASGSRAATTVWVRGGALQPANQTNRVGSVRSDAKGRFRIDAISQGNHVVHVAKAGRPNGPQQRVKVGTGETKKGIRLTMPKGATVRGKLVGAKIGKGWRARLQRPAQSNVIMLPTSVTPLLDGDDPTGTVTVSPDGKFVFSGLPNSTFQLTLLIPYPLGMLEIPIERVRVRAADIEPEFDVSEELPGRLHGEVVVRGAAVPPGRLMVLAQRIETQPNGGWQTVFTSPMLRGIRSLVGPDGRFELPVRKGQHVVKLIDLATGVTLFQSKSRIATKSMRDKEFSISAPVARVDIELVPESVPVADRLELQVDHPKLDGGQRGLILANNGIIYDQGVGIDVRPGQSSVTVLLPKVMTKIYARSHAYQLDPSKTSYNFPPLGQEELVPEPGTSNKIKVVPSGTSGTGR